jgi:hypothetical protein
MDVSQELGSTGGTISVSGGGVRPCDGWNAVCVQAAAAVNFTVGRSTGIAGVPGFQNGAVVQVLNNNFTAAASGDTVYLRQAFEGYRVARLGWGATGAMPLTYAMNFYSTAAGTIFVRLFNAAINRFYYQEHVVAVGWNWLLATVPGDTGGTWLKDNGIGLYFDISVGGKDAAPAAPGGWAGGIAKYQTANSTNLMNATNNQIIVTGFIVLPGIEAPSAARSPLIMRPYDQELVTCKRYFVPCYMGWSGYAAITGVSYGGQTQFPVTMNHTPTMAFKSSVTLTNAASTNVAAATPEGVLHSALPSAVGALQYAVIWTADARL